MDNEAAAKIINEWCMMTTTFPGSLNEACQMGAAALEEVERLRERVARLESELRAVDSILARREAIDKYEHRVDKISIAIREAAKVLPLQQRIAELEGQLNDTLTRAEAFETDVASTLCWGKEPDFGMREGELFVKAIERIMGERRNALKRIAELESQLAKQPDRYIQKGVIHERRPK